MAIATMSRLITSTCTAAVAVGGGVLGYQVLRAGAAADIYRDRLERLSDEYQDLQQVYNRAVLRTAVTELVVDGGKLSVRVLTDGGVVREVPTPYDPRGEVYVDYVVRDGRLWIRRVFDAQTPPIRGILIDPELESVSWGAGAQEPEVGKAVYRALEEGRWVISVTGTGSLGLVRVSDSADVAMERAPQVGDFATVTVEADEDVAELGIAEVWGRVLGKK